MLNSQEAQEGHLDPELLRDQLEELLESPAWAALSQALWSSLSSEDRLLQDHRRTEAQLRWSQGRIEGLRYALNHPQTMIDSIEEKLRSPETTRV